MSENLGGINTEEGGKERLKSNVQKFLEFDLGNEKYGIPLLMVKEVIPLPETTPIPKSPSYFLGIMNLRGHVISVIDLRKKLKISPKSENCEESVIIVDIKGLNLGVVVDSINRVLAFPPEDMREVPELGTQVDSRYIQGVYQKEKTLTVIVDMGLVLDIKDLQILDSQK